MHKYRDLRFLDSFSRTTVLGLLGRILELLGYGVNYYVSFAVIIPIKYFRTSIDAKATANT
jgi:hypothetical protein